MQEKYFRMNLDVCFHLTRETIFRKNVSNTNLYKIIFQKIYYVSTIYWCPPNAHKMQNRALSNFIVLLLLLQNGFVVVSMYYLLCSSKNMQKMHKLASKASLTRRDATDMQNQVGKETELYFVPIIYPKIIIWRVKTV